MLAGGASRRLSGIPKGLQAVGDKRVIDRVAEALRGVTSELLLVANDPDGANWLPGVAVVADLHPGTGGMAGVEAALTGGKNALVVAWDMPFVTTALLQLVSSAARVRESSIVVPESDSPYGFEPFCAWYSADIRPELSSFLERGGGAARDFIGALPRVHRIPMSVIRSVGDPSRLFFSVNTPDDLERARAMASAR